MARTPFSITVPSRFSDLAQGRDYEIADGKFASESASGTKRRKPEGWIPPTPYTFSRQRYDRHEGSCLYRIINHQSGKVEDRRHEVGCVGGRTFNSLNIFNELYINDVSIPNDWVDRALIKARLQMKDSDVNLGVAFAERSKTAQLLGDTCHRLSDAYRLVRKGRFKQASQRLGITNPQKPRGSTVTSKWLELQYGWQPLLSEVYGATEALAKRDRSDWRVTGKGSWFETVDVSKGAGVGLAYGLGTCKGNRGVFVRIDAIPDNEPLRAFASLGITNPALVAWELVPFSFVVDWALPIGDYLDSLDAMLGYGPTWCSISKLTRLRWNHSLQSFSRRAGHIEDIYRISGEGSMQRVRFERTVSRSVPLPSLPRLKDPVSLGHMANGLALLAQVFGGRRS